MSTSKFHWHNTPIWADLQKLGFKEYKTTFQGLYVGNCFAEADIDGYRVVLEMHQKATCNEVSVSIQGLHTTTNYVRTCDRDYPSGRVTRRFAGAYRSILKMVG